MLHRPFGLRFFYLEKTTAPTADKKPRKFAQRAGEPFLNAAKTMNLFQDRLGGDDIVTKLALEALEFYKDKKFFAFVHYRNPDELGHVYGENSKQYSDGIKENDIYLNQIVEFLKSRNLDLGAPKLQQVSQLADVIRAAVEKNETVAVHCLAGIGRTSTMLMAAHILLGESASELELLLKKQNSTFTLTGPHGEFLRSLKN